jgi:hypothetical protein
MTDLKTVVSRSGGMVVRKTGNEYVIIPVSNNIADMDSVFTINETGAFLWEMIDGEKNVEEMINALVSEYEIDYQTALNDVSEFLEQMRKFLVIEER